MVFKIVVNLCFMIFFSASKGSTSASVLVAQEDLVNSMETDALDNSDDSEEDNKNAGSGIVTDDQPLEQRLVCCDMMKLLAKSNTASSFFIIYLII